MPLRTCGATKLGANYVVGVFAALLAVSYFDRFILALLIEPVSQDLGLTDRQMGLLLGFGFSLVYSLAGLPIAYYLDRGNRVLCVSVGALIWCSSTIASGFATSYEQLLALRACVAIGEAVLTPAMISVIADLFDPPDRNRPTTVYIATGTLMAGGAFVIGGLAVDLAESISRTLTDWPVWRLTLLIVGTPGILLAVLLFATVAEPARRKPALVVNEPGRNDSVSVLSHLFVHARFYLPFYLSVGLGISIGNAAFSWMPTVLVRIYGFDIAESGYTFGLAAIPTVVIGTVLWGTLTGHSRLGAAAPIVTMLLGVLVMLAAALLTLVWHGSLATVASAALICGGSACFMPVCAIIVQQATPSPMHARLMAVALLAASVLGAGLGPLITPVIANFWSDDPLALQYALFSHALVVGMGVLLLLLTCVRGYRELIGES